jgi:hypothetical protein
MERNAEVLRELFAEMLNGLERSNVGKLAGRKNKRNANGKAEGKR